MKNTDDKILNSLRRVRIPDDLKPSLRHITEEPVQGSITTSVGDTRPSVVRATGWILLAASLIAVALFVIDPFSSETTVTRNGVKARNPLQTLKELPKPAASADDLLAEMRSADTVMQLQLMRGNRQQIEDDLTRYMSRDEVASQANCASIVLAVANQSGLDYGRDIASVSGDLQQLIAEFPGTSGAKMASVFLDRNNSN